MFCHNWKKTHCRYPEKPQIVSGDVSHQKRQLLTYTSTDILGFTQEHWRKSEPESTQPRVTGWYETKMRLARRHASWTERRPWWIFKTVARTCRTWWLVTIIVVALAQLTVSGTVEKIKDTPQTNGLIGHFFSCRQLRPQTRISPHMAREHWQRQKWHHPTQ